MWCKAGMCLSSLLKAAPFSVPLVGAADQDSVRLLAVESCGAFAAALSKEDCASSLLPVVQMFAQVCICWGFGVCIAGWCRQHLCSKRLLCKSGALLLGPSCSGSTSVPWHTEIGTQCRYAVQCTAVQVCADTLCVDTGSVCGFTSMLRPCRAPAGQVVARALQRGSADGASV
jgi:hypothetical protein